VTERLYLRDPYQTEFDADVVEIRETDEGPALVLDRTCFYPESGGQPFDLGTIDGVPVTKVLEAEGEGEVVLHFVEKPPARKRVHGRVDWRRRLDHMQQHSGQHILSAAFVKEAGAHTLSFHLGAQSSTIDLDKAPLSEADVARAEAAANDAVRRALSVRSRFVSAAEAASLDLRKPPPEAESVRIVEVEGLDHQACCGTHPHTSAEVGPILVRGLEKLKGGTRVEFVCGDRALADYRTTIARIRALASVVSASEADLVATAEKREEERKAMGKELSRLRSEVLLLGVEAWMGDAKRLVKVVENVGPGELRAAASKLTEKPDRIVLLGSVADSRAHLVFACSESVDADMGALLKKSLPAVEGKGGGSRRVAQGGGPRVEGLKESLEIAAEALP
jgi:alanyl-tRNA synthetase